MDATRSLAVGLILGPECSQPLREIFDRLLADGLAELSGQPVMRPFIIPARGRPCCTRDSPSCAVRRVTRDRLGAGGWGGARVPVHVPGFRDDLYVSILHCCLCCPHWGSTRCIRSAPPPHPKHTHTRAHSLRTAPSARRSAGRRAYGWRRACCDAARLYWGRAGRAPALPQLRREPPLARGRGVLAVRLPEGPPPPPPVRHPAPRQPVTFCCSVQAPPRTAHAGTAMHAAVRVPVFGRRSLRCRLSVVPSSGLLASLRRASKAPPSASKLGGGAGAAEVAASGGGGPGVGDTRRLCESSGHLISPPFLALPLAPPALMTS